MKPNSLINLGLTCIVTGFLLSGHARAALTDGLVSYYPLDALQGGKAPDVVSGLNMDAINLSDTNLVDGVAGKAISFDATQQTMLERLHADGDALPIHQYDTITISFWTNTNAQEQVSDTGAAINDLRFFSEGATGNNNPLFNIGTANDGSNNGIDLFIRSSGTTTLNHTKGVIEPLDGLGWHHIVWTQNGAESVLYVDGVVDSADFNLNAFAPIERFSDAQALNTTSIGGIRRGAPSHWITGLIDEVGLWNRTLSADEVVELFNGITPFSQSSALLDGLVSHWPLENVQGGKAVDVISGLNMDAINVSEADVVPGIIGNAISFDATKQTMLERLHADGDALPIHQYDTITISFWTNTNAQEQV
ncbi:MAG: LamG-like jellyroll fold domain-containing protein, partial [Verrucomicrobiales bacterium]